jgi:3',5'-cyclic AMP phosphodiesterase CpdA
MFKPFLQIVHISDLHIVASTFQQRARLRAVLRVAQAVGPISRWLEDGMAPHDVMAPDLFLDLVEAIGPRDLAWSRHPLWIIDTGDLTTFGDDDSLAEGQDFLRRLQQRGQTSSLHSNHGNHDAWPEVLPILAGRQAIPRHRNTLLSRWYRAQRPDMPLACNIPDGSGQVQLYAADSVLHDRAANTRALGEIDARQLAQLTALLAVQQGDPHARNFRILATHHPVHFEGPPLLRCGMVMRNDSAVAQAIGGPGQPPQIQLVMSGHTHALFPRHGHLGQTARHCSNHPILGMDQCQYVVGSLMQMDKFNKRGAAPHQAVVLRFYYYTTNQTIMGIERILTARTRGANGTASGPYQVVPDAKGAPSQQMVFCR